MVLSILDRCCLREAGRLTAFYGVGFLALVSALLVGPLVRGGARLLDVLATLPEQLAFPATIVLPMALATALMATVSRMHTDGEIIALDGSGIPRSRIVRSFLPLVLLTCLAVGVLAHLALPDAYRAFAEAKADLLRQAVATRIAREEPIIDTRGSSLAAVSGQDQELGDVCAWLQDSDGSTLAAYAPHARWVAGGRDRGPQLRLQFDELRGLRWHPAEGSLATLDIPSLVIDLERDAADRSSDAEALATAELTAQIPRLQALRAAVADPHLALGPALRSVLPADDAAGVAEAAELPAILREGLDGPARLQGLQQRLATAGAADAVDQLVLRLAERAAQGSSRERLVESVTRELRAQQFAWHLRWVLALSPLALWLFVTGLGLRLVGVNRLGAIFLALLIDLLALLPAVALVKGMRGNLPIDPGWLLWVPQVLLASWGAWLGLRPRQR